MNRKDQYLLFINCSNKYGHVIATGILIPFNFKFKIIVFFYGYCNNSLPIYNGRVNLKLNFGPLELFPFVYIF